MDFPTLSVIFGQATSTQQGQQPPLWTSLVLPGLLIVVFYFALIRPQQKKAREHADMLKTVRPGDKVVTSGGVLGVVVTVKEKSLSIRSADSKMEITKAAVTEIVERSGESSES